MSQRTMRRLFQAICVATTVVVGLACVEIYFRYFRVANYWTVDDLVSSRRSKKIHVTFDEEIAFRPVVGAGRYTEYGTLANKYSLEKRPGVNRLLFIGDSVTRRAQLIDALRGLYGDEQYEYWNAGVEATDTNQQLWFYTHYNHKIEPDHVFLTFHNNDFVSQPVVDHSGTRVNIYDTMGSCEYSLPWPLAHSACARWLLVRHYQIEKREALAKEAIERSLAALQQRLADDGVGFSVVLFPILKPHADWSATELKSREDALAIFDQLGIEYFDLLPALETALQDGAEVSEDRGDTWHPNALACRYLSRHLQQAGMFESAVSGVPAAQMARTPAAAGGEATTR